MSENTGEHASEIQIQSVGKNMKLFGALTIVMGVLAMMAPMIAGQSVVLMVGVLVIIGGIARMSWAFQASGFGKGLLGFGLGLLTLLCGVALLSNPLFAAGLLTLLLAGYFVADGFFEIAGGFQRRPTKGAGWLIFSGVLSVVLGMMIWQQFPFSGIWAIGILLGIKLLFAGMMMFTVGGAAQR